MVDGVLLVVDAYDGPQAQTRFVLRKALAHGLKVVIVVNKIDRENTDPAGNYNKVLELLLELNASEEQFNAPVVYGSGRDGYMVPTPVRRRSDMTVLFETILEHIPPPFAKPDEPFRMLVSNIDWSDYVGRIAIGKVLGGEVAGRRPCFRRPPFRRRSRPLQDHQRVRIFRPRHQRDGPRRGRQHRRALRLRGHRHR